MSLSLVPGGDGTYGGADCGSIEVTEPNSASYDAEKSTLEGVPAKACIAAAKTVYGYTQMKDDYDKNICVGYDGVECQKSGACYVKACGTDGFAVTQSVCGDMGKSWNTNTNCCENQEIPQSVS